MTLGLAATPQHAAQTPKTIDSSREANSQDNEATVAMQTMHSYFQNASAGRMQKITEDGGIVKIVLHDGPASGPCLEWAQGANAKIHFKVASAPFRAAEKDGRQIAKAPQHAHDREHVHNHACKHAQSAKPGKAAGPNPRAPNGDPQCFAASGDRMYLFDASARTVLEDTSANDGEDNYFELRMGRSFSFQALEMAVGSMREGETSRFLLSPDYSATFFQLAMTLRKERARKAAKSAGAALSPVSSCCMGLASHSMGEEHADLVQAADDSTPLELEVRLVKVQGPGDYERQAWEIAIYEHYNAAGAWKDQAAEKYRLGDFCKAKEEYQRALWELEVVEHSSKGADARRLAAADRQERCPPPISTDVQICPDWMVATIRACRLNIAQCALKLNDPDLAISMCSAVLKGEPDHAKALFRRASAHVLRGPRDASDALRDMESLRRAVARHEEEWDGACQQLQRQVERVVHAADCADRAVWRGILKSPASPPDKNLSVGTRTSPPASPAQAADMRRTAFCGVASAEDAAAAAVQRVISQAAYNDHADRSRRP